MRAPRWTPTRKQRLTLAQLSDAVHVSPFHLQRLFKRVVGVSPRQYQAAQRGAALRDALQSGADVTRATLDAGFGSPSRMYDSAPAELGMAPSAYRRKGAGLTVRYASAPTPLGFVLVAATEKGICKIGFGDDKAMLADELRGEFANAELFEDTEHLAPFIAQIDAYLRGTRQDFDLPLDIAATAFRQRVWDALRRIPYGETRSYSRDRRNARLAARRARGGERVRDEPGGAGDSLSSRRAQGRSAGGLSLGLAAQSRAARTTRRSTPATFRAAKRERERKPAQPLQTSATPTPKPPPNWTTPREYA